jgi:hypothetical protein
VDKVPAVPTVVIPSILRVVENLGEGDGPGLTRRRPNDGPSAVVVVPPVHAPLAEAVVNRLKLIRSPRRNQLTSGGAAAGARARGVGRFGWRLRIPAANRAIGSGLPTAGRRLSLMCLSDEGG